MKRALVGCGIVFFISLIALIVAIRLVLPTGLSYLRYGYADLPQFMERREAMFDGHPVSFLVSKFSPNAIDWTLVNDPSHPQSIQSWRQQLGSDIVINGAYFDEKNQPTGFYQSSSTTPSITPWPSAVDPAGYTFDVEIVDGRMSLFYLPSLPSLAQGVPADRSSTTIAREARSTLLSFPTLLLDGTSLVTSDSGLHARRTVLAQTADGTIFVIVSERGEESLYQMAQWLVAQPEHFTIAGNLDGGPSTGLSTSSSPWDIDIHSALVPNVLAGKLR